MTNTINVTHEEFDEEEMKKVIKRTQRLYMSNGMPEYQALDMAKGYVERFKHNYRIGV